MLRLAACNFARSLDIKAVKLAKITQISEQTLCKLFKQIRILIAQECEKISKLNGEIEIVESYFLLRLTLATASRRCKKSAW